MNDRIQRLERTVRLMSLAFMVVLMGAISGFAHYQSTASWQGNNAQVDGNTSFRATTAGINMGANSVFFGDSFSDTSAGSISSAGLSLDNITADVVKVADGTAAAPSITFAAGADTGGYRVGANNIGWSTGGTLRMDLDSTSLTTTVPYYAPNGTAAAPGFSFASEPDTGTFLRDTGRVGVAVGGEQQAEVTAGYFVLRDDVFLAWDSTGDPTVGGSDLSLSRKGSGVLGVGGATGGTLDLATKTCVETGMSGATVTATDCIPAGSFVIGVSVYVDTLIEGATTFTIGDGSDADRWGTGIAVDATTATDVTDFTAAGYGQFASANDVVLTGTGGSFSAGAVTITVHYISLTAGT